MGRLLGLLVVVAIAALIVWLVMDKIPDVRRNRSQRQLYKYNPEMSDLPRPVVCELARKQQQLDRAAAILQGMLNDQIYVSLPKSHQDLATAWLKNNQKEISQ